MSAYSQLLTDVGLAKIAAACAATAAVGLAPPVELPRESGPRRTTAGNRKVQLSLSSTAFTGMRRARHSAAISRFSAPSPVAAITSVCPSTSCGQKAR